MVNIVTVIIIVLNKNVTHIQNYLYFYVNVESYKKMKRHKIDSILKMITGLEVKRDYKMNRANKIYSILKILRI